ncbi:MAG: hypothetical protein M3O70_01270 [Actinomycetota bacterium]|nr:hypothetical protein [Actinomycetota bacterium]
MSIWAALAGGFVATVLLTSGMRAATALQLTRIDLPFLLGTAFSTDRRKAKVVGYLLHFSFGLLFSLIYYVVFVAIDHAGFLLGGLFGIVHALFAGTALVSILLPAVHPRMAHDLTAAHSAPLVEPPGFMLLSYGRRTPLVAIATHIVYGAVVGGFVALA